MTKVLTAEALQKLPKAPVVKFRKEVYSRFFSPEQSAKEVQSIVEYALEFYFEKQANHKE